LVEISGQKRLTRELSLCRAWSLRAGCSSFSMASSPLAELTTAMIKQVARISLLRKSRQQRSEREV
ncbi:hypothetical protein T12_3505, partial [Trichinella patagoniensis]